MDVIYSNKKKVTYKEIAIGDVFSWYDTMYMKTQRVISITDGGFYNAINLAVSAFALFDDNEEVTEKKAHLIIS